jgi:predicted membrane protein
MTTLLQLVHKVATSLPQLLTSCEIFTCHVDAIVILIWIKHLSQQMLVFLVFSILVEIFDHTNANRSFTTAGL